MATNDPFEVAVQAAESFGVVYGKLDVAARFIVFPEGGGRPREFVDGDDIAKRQTELTFNLVAIDAMNMSRPTERKVIAESAEWSKIVWAALRDFGFKTARDGQGKWFKVTFVPSGRKPYTNKEGVEVTPTTLKFLAVYATEADATAAYEADLGKSNGNGSQAAPVRNDAAMAFLPALVKAANGNVKMLEESLKSNPILAGFSLDSPEIIALLKAEAVPA